MRPTGSIAGAAPSAFHSAFAEGMSSSAAAGDTLGPEDHAPDAKAVTLERGVAESDSVDKIGSPSLEEGDAGMSISVDKRSGALDNASKGIDADGTQLPIAASSQESSRENGNAEGLSSDMANARDTSQNDALMAAHLQQNRLWSPDATEQAAVGSGDPQLHAVPRSDSASAHLASATPGPTDSSTAQVDAPVRGGDANGLPSGSAAASVSPGSPAWDGESSGTALSAFLSRIADVAPRDASATDAFGIHLSLRDQTSETRGSAPATASMASPGGAAENTAVAGVGTAHADTTHAAFDAMRVAANLAGNPAFRNPAAASSSAVPRGGSGTANAAGLSTGLGNTASPDMARGTLHGSSSSGEEGAAGQHPSQDGRSQQGSAGSSSAVAGVTPNASSLFAATSTANAEATLLGGASSTGSTALGELNTQMGSASLVLDGAASPDGNVRSHAAGKSATMPAAADAQEAVESLHARLNQQAAARGVARSMIVRVPADSTGESVQLRMLQRGDQLDLRILTASDNTVRDLRQNLPDLLARLSNLGLHAEQIRDLQPGATGQRADSGIQGQPQEDASAFSRGNRNPGQESPQREPQQSRDAITDGPSPFARYLQGSTQSEP